MYIGSSKFCAICKKKFKWYTFFSLSITWLWNEKIYTQYMIDDKLHVIESEVSIYAHTKCLKKAEI
jgi:hypothetical protein